MKKNAKKKSLLFYSIMLLSILSVGILATLFGPNVKNSVLSMFKNTEEKNSDGSPLRSKTIKDNGDGTYTIALNVTGESEVDTQPNKKANVIIVMDTSGSMEDPADYSTTNINSRRTATGNTVGRFAQNGGYYWRLYYRTGSAGNYSYYPEGTGPEATKRHQNVWYPDIDNGNLSWVNWSNGTRYNFANNNARIDDTIPAVVNAIDTLLGQNTAEVDDMVEISLVAFGSRARYISPTNATGTWTKGSKDGTAGEALKDMVETGLIPYGSTNWDEALYYAQQLAANKNDGDDTYIIFFSDGEPTYHIGTSNGVNSHNHSGNSSGGGNNTTAADINAAYYEANQIHNKNYKLFGIYAYGSGTNGQTYMKNLTSYANYGDTAHAANNHSETVVGNYYFSADNEEAINNAFNQIASFISSNVGFSDVSISDGTTAAKTASSGQGATGSLLKVDTNSYKYYLSFPLNADGTSNSQYITEITKVAGTDNDYQLKSSNGNTYTVTRVPAYKTNSAGKVTTEEDTSIFKFEWKNNVANPLHQENPPVATYNTTKNSVDWDLSTLKDKVLLNGVTYEVTFDCYPSQVTLDIFADVKNGKIKLDTSNEDYDIKAYGDDSVLIEDYIVCNKETKECALMTNTDATLTYTDTRTDDGEQTAHYENPDPVPSSSIKSFAVSKEWENFGSTNGEARIDLNVDRDDSKKHYSVGLSGDNNWKDEIYASIGIMIVNGDTVTVKPGAEGHDYSFSEEQNISYKWELTSPTVRPMLINGVAKSLIKVDKPAGMTGNVYEETPGTNTPDTYEVNSNGKNTYYKIGDNYYVVAKGTATLTATNSRRSYLDVTKSVEGADAPAGSLFEYNMTITEGKGEKVYFSIQDENGNTVTNKEQYMIKDSNTVYVTGATAEISELKANGTDADPNITNVTVNELNHTITYNYGTSTYTVTYVERLSNGNYTYYTGYYYMNSGSTANIKLAADWNIRFTNLSSNTEYTITETNNVYKEDGVTPVTGFKLNKTEIKTSEVRDGADDTYTLVTEGTNRTVQSTMSEANLAYKVAFTNEYVLTHVDVKKVWDDNHNQDGKRTKDANGQDISLEFVLKQNGTIIDRVSHDGTGTTIDEDSDEEYWEYTFNNLNVYDTKGNKYTYTVEEVYNNSAYTTTSDGNATDGYVFTNTHTPETIDITVEKIWKDNNDQDGLRAAGANATITLYDGTTATNYKLETNTNNSTTFTGLPVYRDGEKIAYSVQETETSYITGTDGPGTYDYEITGNATDGFVVTNTHTPETIDITVEKVWKDNNDQDGLRAAGANATITLYDGTTATDNVLTTNEDKDVTFTVDKYRKGSIGVPAQYSVKETETSYITGTDGPGTYAYEITGNVTDGFVVTNTHTPETIDITVEKVWEDNNDQDGLRAAGANATITLYDGTTATDNVLTTNEDKNVTFTVDKYRKGSIGVPAQYSVQETETSYITGIDGPGTYAYEITGNVTDGFVVTNTHTPETRQIKVVKVWSDNNDQDGLRRNGDAVASITLYADNAATENVLTTDDTETIHRTESATYTVDKYADGEEIVYSVQENTIDGYEASEPVKTTEGEVTVFTITNTHTPKTTDITVTKVWDDDNNHEGFRPDSVSIKLYANDKEVGTAEVKYKNDKNNESSWTYTFKDLDVYADGEEITYTIEEIKVDKYESEYDQENLTVTNKREVEPTEVKVTKVWDDNDNEEGFRPGSVTFNLYGVDKTTAQASITLSDNSAKDEAGNWTYTFTDLDKYADGQEINYTVEEVETDVITGEDSTGTYDYEITGDKENGFVITNTHTPEDTKVSVTKVWEDENNKEGFRPTSVQVQLKDENGNVGEPITLNASNSWKYEWTELQKYRDGNEIAYTVEEVKTDVITGTNGTGTYSIAVSGTQATGYTITNTHSSETRSITITKVWDDENNKEGFRPGSIDIELTSQTESETEAKLERVITLDGEKDDIELDKWVATLTGLPKYRNGEEITYSVSETREGNLAEEKGIYTISETGNMNAGFTITNTHEVTPTEVKVTKVWDDESNKEGFRPTSITLILHASDSSIEDQTATVTGNGDEWSYTFPNLLAYSNGQKVTYTVEEVKTDVITGTDSTGTYEVLPIQGNQYTGYTITNKHTPETTTSTVVKVWDDNSNQDKVRPATTELEFQLKANGENVGKPITLNDNGNNQWSYTVDNLPKYANKQLIEYTWTEDESSLPEGYELTSTTKSSDGLTVTLTNHRDTDKITINGKKVWDDSDNNDKVRPTDGIDVQLYANGSAVGEPIHVDSKDNNEWSFSFPDLEVNDANGAITYTVDEVNVPDGYTKVTTETNPTGVGNEANGYTITNKHTKETTSVKVEKVWDDDDNRDAIQPESITIELYANGTDKVGSKVLDGVKDENGEYDSWKAEFTGLDKLLNGNEITYTVKEVETGAINNDSKTGYAIKVTGDQETGYTITNTHEVETTEIKVTKVWDDDDNRDNIRPNEVTVNIYQDGSKTAYRSEKVTFEKDKSENTWYYTFTNLPKYKNVDGKKVEIVYSIDENAVTDYSGKVDNETYTITNSHTPVKTEISGYKVWKDSSNRDAKRPTTVTVKLYADDVFYESKEVTGSGDEWKYTFDQLPKYKNDNGTRKEVKYTVEEVNVPEGYTSTIDEKDPFIIYNTYEAETTKVSGEKTWNDDDNREALRPTSIKVILMADGEEADTKEVKANAEGKWLYSFDELPKYKNVEGKAQEIVYTISEIAPEGYAPSYDIKGNVTNIENVHEIERITIDGVKDWDDEDDIEGFRPEAITINLLADNEKIDSYEATAADGWKYSFEELPKYKNVDGEKVEIKYTLTEESVDGYTADIEGYEITNIHKVERVSFHITKVWDDDDNRDGIRPKSIVVTLNANGVAKQSVTLDGVKDDDEKEPWSYDFVNLPKHSDGKVITYTITEDKHEGYTSSITDIDNNTTEVIITNTHTPERTEVSGTKTWEGDEDHLDQRPKYITVKLYADGELIDTIVVRAEDEWKYIVENLYKYKGGVPIKYTIEEQAVEGYITNYDGFNIINTRDSSGDVVPEELPPHTGVDYKYLYEFIITGLSGLVLLYRKEY